MVSARNFQTDAPQIEEAPLDPEKTCTDATGIQMNGKPGYIRNSGAKGYVLYSGSEKKNIKTLKNFRILREFPGMLIHDHETAMYHFGSTHGECNVHLAR